MAKRKSPLLASKEKPAAEITQEDVNAVAEISPVVLDDEPLDLVDVENSELEVEAPVDNDLPKPVAEEETAPCATCGSDIQPVPAYTQVREGQPTLLVKYVDSLTQEIGYATEGSAGIDLRACMSGCRNRGTRIMAGNVSLFGTGVAVAIPEGYVGLVVMRSGKSAKDGIQLANQVAVIDSDYRGEIKLPLTTDRAQGVFVSNGERVAQLLIVPCPQVNIVKTDDPMGANGVQYLGELEIMDSNKLGIAVVNELPATNRGENGFGHTGSM